MFVFVAALVTCAAPACGGCSSGHLRPRRKSAMQSCTCSPRSPGARPRKTRVGSGSRGARPRHVVGGAHAAGARRRRSAAAPKPCAPQGFYLPPPARRLWKDKAQRAVPCARGSTRKRHARRPQGANGRCRASTVCDAPALKSPPATVCHRACGDVSDAPPHAGLSPQGNSERATDARTHEPENGLDGQS